MKRLRIYLDNCCYNRPYDDQTQLSVHLEALAKLSIQQQIRDNEVDLVTSYILTAENTANRFEAKRKDIQAFINRYTHTYVSEANADHVKQIAQEIMDTGIKLLDACHVACAVIADCDYFISTDKRLLKYHSDHLKIVNPTAYILETEEPSS